MQEAVKNTGDSLIALFSEVLGVPPEQLGEDTSPTNLSKWDSLAAMHLVAAIEDRYDVRLTTREIMKMNSIGAARKALADKNVEI